MSSNHSREGDASKTTSRKAQNKALQTGFLRSSTNSPAMSRAGSRNGTDAEESEGSIAGDSDDQMTEAEIDSWESILNERIEDTLDWKRSSTASREIAIRQYVRILQHRYAMEQISGKEQELLLSFLKSVKQAASEAEVEYALKAIEMTAVTSGLESMFEDLGPRIKRAIEEDGRSVKIKILAIRAYAILAIFSGVQDEAMIETLEFLLDLVTEITAEEQPKKAEDAKPIVAALETYALLATYVEDISEHSTDHVETLMDFLDSSFGNVQVAAAHAIALLFEKSYTRPEKDEIFTEADRKNLLPAGPQSDSIEKATKIRLVKRYEPARNRTEVSAKLEAMTKKAISVKKSKDVKTTRKGLEYALDSIQHPGLGPMYEHSSTFKGTRGHTLQFRINSEEKITVNTWWKYFRVTSLRHCLQGGFMMHYEHNPLIDEMASILFD